MRKKKIIDGMDREILRTLYNNGSIRTASGAMIANAVRLSPPAIKPRLVNLKNQGIIKQIKCGGNRTFNRTFGKKNVQIIAPSKVCWGLNLKPKRKK